MHPILFEWGPIRIGSYGLLLTLAFLSAIYITNREFRKNGVDVSLAWDIYLLAILGGIGGSKILYIIENFGTFCQMPLKMAFSPAGFSVIGGYLLAVFLSAIRIKKEGKPFLLIADLTAPGLAIGYAVGRLGCIAAGDGCYGLPTTIWCAMHFPNGLVPTLSAKNPLLAKLFLQQFPGQPLPVDIGVHPTPLYESLSQSILLGILLSGNWTMGPGRRFAFFLGWFGISRFLVEFIRLNPIWRAGLTSDQWLSIGIVLTAVIVVLFPRFRKPYAQS